MAGREKECRWHFDRHTGRAEGPSNAMMQNFRENPYNSLVRESIQNSLDAKFDKTKPVRVVFSFKSLNNRDFENFFDLKKHIQGCIDYFPTDEKAKILYGGMLDNFPSGRSTKTIDYIRISDFNTKGMWYIDDEHTDSPFFAFVRAAGVSAKEENSSGGCYGFGKSAYYQISPIASIIVSTQTIEGDCFFEGAAALCTHKVNGEIKTSVGYYDNNDGKPTSNEDMIPVPFKRHEPGSDINIMAFDLSNKSEAKDEMVEATLKNFWYAIMDGKLEVVVEDVNITEESINDLMIEHFPSMEDNTRKAGYYNPRPYYEAVKHAKEDDDHRIFKATLPHLGKVILYTLKDENATDKVAYFRQPRMLVYAKRTQSSYGAYGVFICKNDEGNVVLKNLEDPSHSIWKNTNWRDGNNRIVSKGSEALDAIYTFVNDSIASLYENEVAEETEITDLADYLYVPSELMPEDETDEAGNNAFTGAISGEYIPEGSSITTNNTKQSGIENNTKMSLGTAHVVKSGKTVPATELDEDSDEHAIVGIHTRSKNKKKKKGKGNSPGDDMRDVPVNNDAEGSYQAYVPVRFKCAAQLEGNSYVHYLFIYTDIDVLNGELELVVAGEQSDDKVDLLSSNNGVVSKNYIRNVRLMSGVKNTIKVRFVDNMKYSIKLTAYENR